MMHNGVILIVTVIVGVIAIATWLAQRAAYDKGFEDGRRFERFTYMASWQAAVDCMEEDGDA